MSKTICEVCGTSYPETATQCPVCGTAKSNSGPAENMNLQENAEYNFVKGGRFSQSNVRKRNGGKAPARVVAPAKRTKEKKVAKVEEAPVPQQQEEQNAVAQDVAPISAPAAASVSNVTPEAVPVEKPARRSAPKQKTKPAPKEVVADAPRPKKKNNNKWGRVIGNAILILIVILLVAAIVAVCGYLAMKLAQQYVDPTAFGGTTTTQMSPTGTSSTNKTEQIPCTSVKVQMPSKTFNAVGESLLLEATVEPANTTDIVTFESSDPSIACVYQNGSVVAVAKGTVTITIRCGAAVTTCEIDCSRLPNDPAHPTQPPATTDPTEPTTRPTEPPVVLQLNRTEFTLYGFGNNWTLSCGNGISREDVIWTSSNPQIARVENGKVTAVSNGTVIITAEYMGQKDTCKVICTGVTKGDFLIYRPDRTVTVGESFVLSVYLANENAEYIKNDDGENIRIDTAELKFSVSDDEALTVDENGKVKALKSGTYYVYVEHNGVVQKCVVRVQKAAE